MPPTNVCRRPLRDSLSEILTGMRVTSVLPVRFESSGGYAMRFPT